MHEQTQDDVHSPAHSPPLPAIAEGRRAYSPTWKRHGTVGKTFPNGWTEFWYATRLSPQAGSVTCVLTRATELIPVE